MAWLPSSVFFGFNGLLVVRLECAVLLCLCPEPLHSIHQVGFLREEGIPQIGRPLNLIRELFNDTGKGSQSLHTRVPVLLRYRFGQRVSFNFLFSSIHCLS